jgi:hypothetical protein
MIGVCAGNEVADYRRFRAWAGSLGVVNVFLDQRSRSHFTAGRNWSVDRGAEIGAVMGATVCYSLPFPGPTATEAERVARGDDEEMYKVLFNRMLRAIPRGDILIRLPWEFNLNAGFQNQSAVSNPRAFLHAWRRLAMLAKITSPRFKVIWCPNVCSYDIDPLDLYPWMELVDIVAQDFYLDASWALSGTFRWMKEERRGLDWAVDLAIQKGKQYAVSEWGVSSDTLGDDMRQACEWMRSVPNLHHHCWWDREDGPITSAISTGARPMIGAIYKESFASAS